MQHSNTAGCILLKFYIKPQHTANVYNLLYVVSYRNSTSNHNFFSQCYGNLEVVSYRNSTSNHNGGDCATCDIRVVSYRNSTSNHNEEIADARSRPLYLIEILHQTTTIYALPLRTAELYLIEILHQTTTRNFTLGCAAMLYLIEILHQTTTEPQHGETAFCCILSKFYIKPQREFVLLFLILSCILSKFYIKPQLVHHLLPCE